MDSSKLIILLLSSIITPSFQSSTCNIHWVIYWHENRYHPIQISSLEIRVSPYKWDFASEFYVLLSDRIRHFLKEPILRKFLFGKAILSISQLKSKRLKIKNKKLLFWLSNRSINSNPSMKPWKFIKTTYINNTHNQYHNPARKCKINKLASELSNFRAWNNTIHPNITNSNQIPVRIRMWKGKKRG